MTIFAIWQPMLLTNRGAPTTGTLSRLSDRRVQQFYDANHLIAKRLKADARSPQSPPDCCTQKGILWDLMALYPSGVTWIDTLPLAQLFNGPVVNVTDGLEKALKESSESRSASGR